MCLFCDIAAGEMGAEIVFENEATMAFLDHRPIFPGHSLLIPREHYETLGDLPVKMLEPFFRAGQVLSVCVRDAMAADGTFVAMNNRVSQSVPHLHAHIVPRRYKDGLRGFFWPRGKYADGEARAVAERVRAVVETFDWEGE
jgi:histidine triad (HIT) family protein